MDHGLKNQKLLITSQLLEESQKIAKVGGWELDLLSGDLFWTAETYRIHDTSPEEFNPTVDAGVSYFLPESKQKIKAALDAAINHGIGYDLELETYTTKGRKIDVRTTCIVTLLEGKAIKLMGIFQDISGYKATQHKLEQANLRLENIANYDVLTGLPNRVLLADRMQQTMIRNRRQSTSVAIAFLDLDGFKEVNDTYGHSFGDKLLVKVATNIKSVLRESDTFARFGGDEFVAIIDGFEHSSDCEPLLENMLRAASETISIDNTELKISASIGVTLYPQDGVNSEQLLRHADQAMYIAKQLGRNRFYMFDVEKNATIKAQRENISHIREGLKNNEFTLFYQPKVNMRTGEVVGTEALIRWEHPSKGLLPPSEFLPFIEIDQLSIELGEWVIYTALNQMNNWRLSGFDIPVSVNVGALQLNQIDFSQRLELFLEQFPNIERHKFELEILETSAFSDIQQVSNTLANCQSLGVQLSLDDFGTGYSSLTYLKRLPAQFLKIDQSFVRDMLDDSDDLSIIQGVISLAEAFQRKTIAEGVETIDQGKKLISMGCLLAQGYCIARPMPASEVVGWIKVWQPYPEWTKDTPMKN